MLNGVCPGCKSTLTRKSRPLNQPSEVLVVLVGVEAHGHFESFFFYYYPVVVAVFEVLRVLVVVFPCSDVVPSWASPILHHYFFLMVVLVFFPRSHTMS